MRISDWSSDVCSSDLIDVSGREAGELGGSIDIHGGNVLINEPDVTLLFAPPPASATAVDNPAHLDASGVAGGGSIRIGADNVVAITATRGLDAMIGRAHVCTQVTNAHLVCRVLLTKT